MNRATSSLRPQRSIFAKIKHQLGHIPIPTVVRRRKRILLIAATLFLAAIVWCQRTSSTDELQAYRLGYGMGKSLGTRANNIHSEDLATEMGVSEEEEEMFETGFIDGSNGRRARFDVPERFGLDPDAVPGGAYIEPPSLEDNEPESAPGDYAMNALYGEIPPETKPSTNETENPAGD